MRFTGAAVEVWGVVVTELEWPCDTYFGESYRSHPCVDIEYAPRVCGKRKTLVLVLGTEGMRVGVMLKLSHVNGSSVSRLGVRKADRWQSNALFALVVQWLPTTIKSQ